MNGFFELRDTRLGTVVALETGIFDMVTIMDNQLILARKPLWAKFTSKNFRRWVHFQKWRLSIILKFLART
jgi:hypothetical protein